MSAQTKSAELKLYRELNAPLATVWEAWSDPEQIAQWWGPRGFSITTHSKNLETGGTWKYTMHGPDGTDWENFTTYIEVEKQKKLVYDHGATETTKALFRVTVLFSEVNGKTHMDMTMAFPDAETAQASARFIKKANGDATWDRLAEYLEKQISGKEIFVINRSFEAPIDLLFKMWTTKEDLEKWAGPEGAALKYKRCDVRDGGSAFYEITDEKNSTFFGHCQYSQIRKPEYLVYAQQFCDEQENDIKHPYSPGWPISMLTKVQLTEEDAKKTRLTLTWEPAGECSQDELKAFANARGEITKGWSGAFDKLEAHLENL